MEAPQSSSDTQLRRGIGKLGVATIAMNGVIGSGIFALPAVAIAQAGYFSPWLFFLCGLLILTVALTFARLASFFDVTGGPVVYTTVAFGRYVGFQTGFLIYLSRVAAIAASANLIVSHAAALWSPLGSEPGRSTAIIVYLAVATLLNTAGVRAGLAVVYLISVLKLLPLFLLILVGLPSAEWARVAQSDLLPVGQAGESMLVLMYAFIGFEFSLINAGETRDAARSIPRTLVQTVLAIAICYALIQLVVVSVAPDIGNSETPLVEVARRLLGSWGALVLTLGVVFSIGGGSLTSLLTAPRLTFALARDGSLPAWFGRVNPSTGAPANSILFCGILSAAMAVGQTFVWLTVLSTFIRLVTYLLCIASLPGIERRMPVREGQFSLPGGLTIPVLAGVLTIWLLSHSTLYSIWITGAIAMTATLVFWYTNQRTASRKADGVGSSEPL